MGSLRNPVGPLPSSIYWRRRAVALCLMALLAALALWAVSSGGSGGKSPSDGANGASPAPSITPGPSSSGPAISEQPGGRDESGDSGGDGSGDADTGGSAGGDGKNGDTTNGGGAGGAGGANAAQQVPATSPLPNCAPGALKLTLRSLKVSYEQGEKPGFELIARNTSAAECKADFGPKSAVLTISDAQDDEVWSSKDCPRPAAGVFLRIPAGTSVTHTVQWDRRPSAPLCATPPAGTAAPGTYLVEAAFPGTTVLPASFTLAKD
ncbi:MULTISPECIES: hypothetical protein [Streptomyces]|uniref:DUF4232 domain-containing protein n=1 Tax=Streptomyces solicathayae TaxID=3081768 RepID=A0ABZ0LTY0_9ACTN|nr:hypothetical protein [Streptomyces sp. HUAS YS2]WOX22892.1 hypothetical protein R2D22_16405 [Streptomyces sp. HUAS YS2]